MKVHLKTLGCRLNEAELETWAQGFQKSGYQITLQPESAHIVIINSCAVTQDAARKSRNLIRRIHRENPAAKLVVSGCYATLNQQEAESLIGVDLVINNSEKNQLVEKTLAELNLDSMPAMSQEPGAMSLFTRGRQRAFVKVQDGCRYRCTFCIVTVARGEEKSRSINEIVQEINSLKNQGINEVVLTGVHLGGYGSDLNEKLSSLIYSILRETEIPRIRLGSLEPWELTDHFFELFADPRVMQHLHLPLQSGSDSVLKRMARRCKTSEFAAIVKRLRESIPHFNISTDVIVGFPGETEQEWQDSLGFIEQIGFGHIHVFSYSRREGTKAASLPEQVDDNTKRQRSRELQALADRMKYQFFQANIGKDFHVLWEGYTEPCSEGKKLAFGYTPNYLRVACQIDSADSLENQILKVKVTQPAKSYVYGELI